jgi:hypothetical protein
MATAVSELLYSEAIRLNGLFLQEKATLHDSENGYIHSEIALKPSPDTKRKTRDRAGAGEGELASIRGVSSRITTRSRERPPAEANLLTKVMYESRSRARVKGRAAPE